MSTLPMQGSHFDQIFYASFFLAPEEQQADAVPSKPKLGALLGRYVADPWLLHVGRLNRDQPSCR